ncbi:hypothetical protein QQX98_004273 [Neonectria punicea]|uniref:C3H1-type domain-containing protein n=1 Tax=Neonectria punicea TaxID=979145 RepID=A0ABR1HA90_9HYPO
MPSPKPQFFLIRPGLERFTTTGELIVQPGKIVPLVPIDLLPEWLEVVGVPRCLRPDQTVGMNNLGSIHAETETYRLKFIHPDEDTESQDAASDDTNESGAHSPSPSTASSQAPSRVESTAASNTRPRPVQRASPQGLAASRHNPLNNNANANSSNTNSNNTNSNNTNTAPAPAQRIASPPSSSPPPPTRAAKKAAKASPCFCRHWCHHGTCKWGLACRFQHAMPNDFEGLAAVGLADFPDWWLAAVGVLPMPPGSRDTGAHKAAAPKKRKQKKEKGSAKTNSIQGSRPEEKTTPVGEPRRPPVLDEDSEMEDPVQKLGELSQKLVIDPEECLIEM